MTSNEATEMINNVQVPAAGDGDHGAISVSIQDTVAVAASTQEAQQSNHEGIVDPLDEDILSGRGAKVNARPGNKKFRALCFAQKQLFELGNIAAKRRIATEIVLTCQQEHHSRFLKRTGEDGPWFEMTMEQAIQKACQTSRDHKRPDREARAAAQNGRKRDRKVESTPMATVPMQPLAPLMENPYGIGENDILSGRGAFVNGHVGNRLLRKMALERKAAFDNGTFTEKQALASEIVAHIRSLNPPGRFLKKAPKGSTGNSDLKGLSGEWEELSDEKATHKACQVMRDIHRPDRAERAAKKKGEKDVETALAESLNDISAAAQMIAEETATEAFKQASHAEEVTPEESPKVMAVEETVLETVAAAEAALNQALETTFV